MRGLSALLLQIRPWLILCLGTLGTMVLMSVLAHVFMPADVEAAGRVVLPVYFALFLVLGFSAVPLMTNLLVAGLERMWTRAGILERPADARAMAALRRYRVHFVLAVWGMYIAGLVIATPYIIEAWREAAR